MKTYYRIYNHDSHSTTPAKFSSLELATGHASALAARNTAEEYHIFQCVGIVKAKIEIITEPATDDEN